jgi:thioredoxin 1
MFLLQYRCPPCKTAAPLYHKLSDDKKFADVKFRKCNVDIAADVSKACSVSQMPTFKVFKNGAEVETVVGWNEGKMRAAIKKAMK